MMRFIAIVLLSTLTGSNAFAPNSFLHNSRLETRLFNKAIQDRERELRQEIADRNTKVDNEEKYGVADGAFMNKTDAPLETSTVSVEAEPVEDTKSMAYQLEQITKPRPYPLFLVEKTTEFLELTTRHIAEGILGAPEIDKTKTKERVILLGTGWGGAAFVSEIDTTKFDVTVISPRNYFVFTPMLAGASVGTVEYRSICQPIREINRHVNYLEATAVEVDPKKQTILCEAVVCEGNSCDIKEFEVEYDRLIVSVGAQTNTFGIPGVRENCNFLKQIGDARRIRTAIVNCFERANVPGQTDDERKATLTFAVIGAGPTGIEFAAELRDFVEQEGPKYWPQLLKYVRIKVIEATDTVLAPFDKQLQQEAIDQMLRPSNVPEAPELVELMLKSGVKEITEHEIILNNERIVPYGMSVWAAGNGPIPFTLQVIEALGEDQAAEQGVARGRIAIDPWMRAIGGEGKILAFGDCACITKGQLPATGQVALQQAEYLAEIMNKGYYLSPPKTEDGILPPPLRDPGKTKSTLSDSLAAIATKHSEYAKPFQFWNLGILAYTGGDTALSQISTFPDVDPFKLTGKIGNSMWKGVYLYKQVSWRNRLLVANDWMKRQFFGRDITRL